MASLNYKKKKNKHKHTSYILNNTYVQQQTLSDTKLYHISPSFRRYILSTINYDQISQWMC